MSVPRVVPTHRSLLTLLLALVLLGSVSVGYVVGQGHTRVFLLPAVGCLGLLIVAALPAQKLFDIGIFLTSWQVAFGIEIGLSIPLPWIFLTATAVKIWLDKRRAFAVSPLDRPFLLYIVCSAITIPVAGLLHPIETIGVHGLRGSVLRGGFQLTYIILMYLMYRIAYTLLSDRKALRRFWQVYFAGGLFASLFAFYQVVMTLGWLPVIKLPAVASAGSGPHVGLGSTRVGYASILRPFAFDGEPVGFGVFLISYIPVLLLLTSTKRWRSNYLLFASLISLAALLSTVSRTAWLGFGAALLLVGATAISKSQLSVIHIGALILIGALVFSTSYSLATGQSFSLADLVSDPIEQLTVGTSYIDRTFRYQIAIRAFLEDPLVGVGLGNYPFYFSQVTGDYSSLSPTYGIHWRILSESGLLGYLSFAYLLLVFYRQGINRLSNRMDGELFSYLLGAMLSITGLLVSYLFTFYRAHHYFWLILAAGMAAWRLAGEENEDHE